NDAERSQLLGSVRPAPVVPAVDEPAFLPLPLPGTSFIGRERELAAVIELLACNRLLTLTGVGGSGKTRLAIEAARATADAYPDGRALVLLAPIADPNLVATTIARRLGIREI